MAELAYLVNPLEVGHLDIEASGGDGFSLFSEAAEGFELAGDDADEEEEHQQQADSEDDGDGAAQAVETTENIALGTDDGH